MACEVEITDEFHFWWDKLTDQQRFSVTATVEILQDRDVTMPFPLSSQIQSSKYGNMRELRIRSGGSHLRVFYAFDPRRVGILLIGGDKTGNDRFYDVFVPKADTLYETYIGELKKEGLL